MLNIHEFGNKQSHFLFQKLSNHQKSVLPKLLKFFARKHFLKIAKPAGIWLGRPFFGPTRGLLFLQCQILKTNPLHLHHLSSGYRTIGYFNRQSYLTQDECWQIPSYERVLCPDMLKSNMTSVQTHIEASCLCL